MSSLKTFSLLVIAISAAIVLTADAFSIGLHEYEGRPEGRSSGRGGFGATFGGGRDGSFGASRQHQRGNCGSQQSGRRQQGHRSGSAPHGMECLKFQVDDVETFVSSDGVTVKECVCEKSNQTQGQRRGSSGSGLYLWQCTTQPSTTTADPSDTTSEETDYPTDANSTTTATSDETTATATSTTALPVSSTTAASS